MDIDKFKQLYEQAFNATPLSFKRDLVRYIDFITKDKDLYSTIQEQVDNAKSQSLQQLLEVKEAARQDMLQTVSNLAEYLDTGHIRKRIETSSDLEYVKDDLDDEIAKVESKITDAKQFLRFDKNQNFLGWHSENYQKYLSEKAKVEHTLDFQVWVHWENLFSFYTKATDYKKNWLKKPEPIEKYKDHLQAFQTSLIELLQNELSPSPISKLTIHKDLVEAIPSKDKRLKAARRMAELYSRKDIVSDFELARCINPKLSQKDFNSVAYHSQILTRIKTLRKYWSKYNITLPRVHVPIKGYKREISKLDA